MFGNLAEKSDERVQSGLDAGLGSGHGMSGRGVERESLTKKRFHRYQSSGATNSSRTRKSSSTTSRVARPQRGRNAATLHRELRIGRVPRRRELPRFVRAEVGRHAK